MAVPFRYARPARRGRLVERIGVVGFAAMLVVLGGAALLPDERVEPGVPLTAPYRVLDGDTLEVAGTRVRLADIDAPELFSPVCAAELQLAVRAKSRLMELVGEGATLSGSGTDFYGRELRVVMRGGVSVGQVMVAEGLARKWDGTRRGWC